MARLIAIAKRSLKKGPMYLLDKATITIEGGINDSYRDKPEKRRVTILRREGWIDVCKAIGKDIEWIYRRANLLIDGLKQCEPGTKLTIGSAILKITGETKPCNRMDDIFQGLQEALAPDCRGGMTCKVLQAGDIEPGDTVIYVRPHLRSTNS